jgi:hypothetical protein
MINRPDRPMQVGLDREARAVQLSDGSELQYDLLLITCGLQEQTCNEMVRRSRRLIIIMYIFLLSTT